MELEHSPSLPHAHQQIRLADCQASTQKWSSAIEYYTRAIGHFRGVQSTLQDQQLIFVILPQIEQCEKAIHLCRLKDRAEQVTKAQQLERLSKITRAHSSAGLKDSPRPARPIQRHNTVLISNTAMLDGQGGMDSLSAQLFAKKETGNLPPAPRIAKKNQKHDAHKIEELRISYEAIKSHLVAVLDDNDRLKEENNILRIKGETRTDSPHDDLYSSLTNASREEDDEDDEDHEDDDEPDTEIEATL